VRPFISEYPLALDQQPQTPPEDRLLGRTLGDFVVRGKLGQGGFRTVYRAEQPALGRGAVVKVLRCPPP